MSSKVPLGYQCEPDEISPDGLGDGDGAATGEPSDSADGFPSEFDGDDSVSGTGLLKKESRSLVLSRIDSNLCFGIADEAIANRR